MGSWLEHTVTTQINAPVQRVWNIWSDLEAMPLWMTWIESVKTIDDEAKVLPDITEWTLAANGFRFKWKAKINQRIEKENLQWESIGGLPTKGSVYFESKDNQMTKVKLIISYELPKMLARLMEENILGKMVTNELQTNLNNFKSLVESEYGQ
ncbi:MULTISPECIES: SRPBCC family protein [Prochlorococcus]|uniref:SRPBCC family protein n=1 Tax=Prochlorococcus TaxID=1218 RepID=UPI000533807E|nr:MULTISPECIES: SRPBCC family protein [Prochlorococcus]KGG13260.1 Oligoketide cyclase/lipid transport protein [Prochlorococcus sp. MIT 0601]